MQKTVKEWGVNDLLGLKFVIDGNATYTISRVDKLEKNVTIHWECNGIKSQKDYSIDNVLHWLKMELWQPITPPPSPCQQSEALLNEFAEYMGYAYNDNSINKRVIKDFLTSKYGKG